MHKHVLGLWEEARATREETQTHQDSRLASSLPAGRCYCSPLHHHAAQKSCNLAWGQIKRTLFFSEFHCCFTDPSTCFYALRMFVSFQYLGLVYCHYIWYVNWSKRGLTTPTFRLAGDLLSHLSYSYPQKFKKMNLYGLHTQGKALTFTQQQNHFQELRWHPNHSQAAGHWYNEAEHLLCKVLITDPSTVFTFSSKCN